MNSKSLNKEARICYDKQGFFAAYLQNLRKKLRHLGARKVQRGGAWYWVLKEDYKPGEEIEL